jgi:hypothetical protein
MLQIAAADAGNGGTNLALAKENGGYKTYYEPSVRAIATGDSLGLGADFELQYDYVDWYGYRYVTGDDVVRITRRGLERHMGVQRYGEEFHRFLVAVGLAKLGVKEGEVNLTLFAPPGLFKEAKRNILEGFWGQDGGVKIKLSKDKKPREWRYTQVNVYPEGVAAAMCFSLDEMGNFTDGAALAGDTIILDSGAFTLDALKMQDGNINAENLEHATWENAGVHTHIREPLLRKIHAQGEDFSLITEDDVDFLLRRGLSTGDYTLKAAGYEMNLKPLCEKHFERYADWISNNVCDRVFSGFRGIRNVILVGGGAVMIEDKLKALYPGKILDRKKHPSTKKIHPVEMNAVGGLRLALMNAKKAT